MTKNTTRALSGLLLIAGLATSVFANSKLPSANKFRVLFYGQSITAQPWTSVVQKRLIERYPNIDFEFANPAIGGFISTALVRSAEHDLYPWVPDLLIFHVYGPAKEIRRHHSPHPRANNLFDCHTVQPYRRRK